MMKNIETQYVQIHRKAIEDPNLSLDALGLLLKCLANTIDFYNHSQEKSPEIRSALQELIDNGYAIKAKSNPQDEEAKYLIFEEKLKGEELEEHKKLFENTVSNKNENKE